MENIDTIYSNIFTKKHRFHPSVRFFCMMEDLFDEILITTMEDGFNSFIEVKDLAVGDTNVFRVSE